MDRPNPLTPNSSNGPKSPGPSGPFAYQTRLLERTSSRRDAASLSRSNSQTSISILTNTTGSSVASIPHRRWTPGHRPASSLDLVRGRWEERSRGAVLEESSRQSSSPTKEFSAEVAPNATSSSTGSTSTSSNNQAKPDHDRPLTPTSSASPPSTKEAYATPKYLKRQTMPAPIVTSPLSPNSTGIVVEADSHLSSTPFRIHIPVQGSGSPVKPSWRDTPEWNSSPLAGLKPTSPNAYALKPVSPSGLSTTPISSYTRTQRSHTLDSTANWTPSHRRTADLETPISPPKSDSPKSPHSAFGTKLATTHSEPSAQTPPIKPVNQRPTRTGSISSFLDGTSSSRQSSPTKTSSATAVMHPKPYRSSYMASRKAESYTDVLSVTGKPKLGNHLPRIASGDADDSWVEELRPKKAEEPRNRRLEREKRLLEREAKINTQRQSLTPSGIIPADGTGVAGLPGRISLKAPNLGVPTPSSRLLGGSWADKQRHLLHAYEYLCHVGEAQQWIEGCLGEELGFGVVEMEDGLRNGVVLARLVRVFQGEASVRRIYEVCFSFSLPLHWLIALSGCKT